ncbi:MAG: hypothetical protein EYC62_06415 [Alphaproteobacteria bacterium]|nr:MAG: hypothetical protein EYC62_06415 [Alphaproteobacteria bacterium]
MTRKESSQNTKTTTLIGIIQTALASGNLQIESSALPELFQGDMVANVHAKVPDQYRKRWVYGDNRDLMSIAEVVAHNEFDANFKGWVARAARTRTEASKARGKTAGDKTGRAADELARRAKTGEITTAAQLGPDRRARGAALVAGVRSAAAGRRPR